MTEHDIEHDPAAAVDQYLTVPDVRQAEHTQITTDLAYTASIALPNDDSTSITVDAFKGTQAIGSRTGDPMDATDPGPVRLTVDGDDGETATLTLPWETATVLRDVLNIAVQAADTRDYRNDKPRRETP